MTARILCESFTSTFRDEKSCNMHEKTVIDSNKRSIAMKRDVSIVLLHLTGNKKISFLPIRVDKNFPNLTNYDAPDCSIISISKENFRNVWYLKKLNLNQNKIQSFPSNTFDDLNSLTSLSLGMLPTKYSQAIKTFHSILQSKSGDNQIEIISRQHFQRLRVLSSLYLYSNRIKNIPTDTFNTLGYLWGLYLGEKFRLNRWSFLSSRSNLGNNKIEFISTEMFQNMKRLNCLSFHINQIETIANVEFGGHPNFDELFLSMTSIFVVQYSDIQFKFSLCAGGNKLKSISAENFSNMENLKRLYLFNNSIERIPDNAFKGLSSLEVLLLGTVN